MSTTFYFAIIIFSFVIFLCYRYVVKKRKEENEKKLLADNKLPKENKLTLDGLIISRRCSDEYPSYIRFYFDKNDKETEEILDKIIKEFDPKTYRFEKITDPKIHVLWRIKNLPCLRGYGPFGLCRPSKYLEHNGEFDEESIRKFLKDN